MKWTNLLNNKCPKCGKLLDHKSDFEYMLCDISCGFQISTQRMKEICSDQLKYRVERDGRTVDNSGDEPLQELSDML